MTSLRDDTRVKHWGHAKAMQWFQDVADDGLEHGLYRTVDSDVQYSPSNLPHVWQPTKQQQKYYMPLPGFPGDFRTLKEIADDILSTDDDHARAALLDDVADRLLKIVRVLHEEHRILGLVTPENILVSSGSIVLLDHGFWHDGLVSPRWIKNPPYEQIWEPPKDRKQIGKKPMDFDERLDLRILTRLYQGLLTGLWQSVIVSGKESREKTKCNKLWRNLEDACNGSKSLDQFAVDLKKLPLSTHFLGPTGSEEQARSEPSPGMGKILRGSIAMLLLLGGIAYATYYVGVWPPPPPPPPPPSVPVGSAVAAALKPIRENGQITPLERFQAIQSAINVPRSSNVQVTAEEKSLIDSEIQEAMKIWSAQFDDAYLLLNTGATRAEAFDSIIELRDQISIARQFQDADINQTNSEKIKSCVDRVKSLRLDRRFPKSVRDSFDEF
ncbi:MAG TPA: hypothetical protein DDZ51_22740 [Planctomycetaceae bacterium]|nr:hypothetical protein [Planctomycetaceae bacterium]